MVLSYTNFPEDVIKAVRTVFSQLEASNVPPVDRLAPLRAKPVYTVTLQSLAQGRATARQLGWHFLATDARNAPIGSDVPNAIAGQPHRASRSEGRAVDLAWEAYNMTTELPDVVSSQHNFELRLLRIHGLLLEAYWMKAEPHDNGMGPDDLVVPYHTYSKLLMSQQVWPMPRFLEVAGALARRRLAAPQPRD